MFRLRDVSQALNDLLTEFNLVDPNTYDHNELEQILIELTKGCGLRPHVIELDKNTGN